MTVLPEYPCIHPSKGRSQNRKPWGKEWFNTCGLSFRFLDCSPLQSFYLNLSPLCIASLTLHSLNCLFFSSTWREKEEYIFFLLYYLNIHWECGRRFCSNWSTILSLPATLLIGSSINLTFHSVSLDRLFLCICCQASSLSSSPSFF